MAEHERDTVTVEVLKYHTFDGVARDEGTTYDIDPQRGEGGYAYLDTLEAGGLVRRVEKPKRRAK
jgi:hypothetical protein